MALIALVLVPLVTGLGLVVAGRGISRRVLLDLSGGAALVTLGLAIGVAVTRPEVDHAWLPELGVRVHLAVDGISIPLILLTVLIGVLVLAHARDEQPDGGSPATFLGCLLVVVGGALATFVVRDVVLFFIAFEVVLVPMWVLITRFGDPHRRDLRAEAGNRFILYTAAGSTLMLLGILLLVTSAGTSDMTELVAAGAALTTSRQVTIALLLTIGLAVKVPVFPLHTWLPWAHTIAPTGGSVLLAAVLLKMGTYGLVRLPLGLAPEGFAVIGPWLALAGVTGIIWGSLICLVERDLKRLIAYSSVAHMGFVVLGIATGSEAGVQAALYGNIAHGVISALLFVIVGGLKRQWHLVDLGRPLPALREIAPRRGFFLVLALAAALGLPGLAGFWGEFLAIVAAWGPPEPAPVGILRAAAVVAAIGGALAAAYSLRVARLLWAGDPVDTGAAAGEAGPAPAEAGPAHEAPALSLAVETAGVERAVHLVLALAIGALGILPWFLFDLTGPAVRMLVGGGS